MRQIFINPPTPNHYRHVFYNECLFSRRNGGGGSSQSHPYTSNGYKDELLGKWMHIGTLEVRRLLAWLRSSNLATQGFVQVCELIWARSNNEVAEQPSRWATSIQSLVAASQFSWFLPSHLFTNACNLILATIMSLTLIYTTDITRWEQGRFCRAVIARVSESSEQPA